MGRYPGIGSIEILNNGLLMIMPGSSLESARFFFQPGQQEARQFFQLRLGYTIRWHEVDGVSKWPEINSLFESILCQGGSNGIEVIVLPHV